MLNEVIEIAIGAGQKIMGVYNQKYKIEQKADLSPLTVADQLSHEWIQGSLAQLPEKMPILSEEGSDVPYGERRCWKTFWMVDPLDGTKEFIKRNGEFTVNIALISENRPVLGVIYAPALDMVYCAEKGKGAYKIHHASSPLKKKMVKIATSSPEVKKVILSRSHLNDATSAYVASLQQKGLKLQYESIGSSLKFCQVAEGTAHYYPRYAPTMEWDTAAGQIIVEEANGQVLVKHTGMPLQYNKENLTNPAFLCTIPTTE
ncbi:3'(2'),5'-bisphosphate nucleotidase CysQ [Bacillus sp. KH172YL63]|uniref:3'(2'),5'-bisphosphate nucleotidase CysQ n=1 Tax=Bacillus sp. KH172YL63 TaxID=2709784 RepID=UPI0013E4123D|nr:3'(2'),5'-bisphosphate nucleotidase CysQ [Bacillus sp. KH172YL63]BCB03451.1 3'(2'),5'-bisphosphate nucleotidase CysQ [Bacillus sp. KH172YL63]